jgi:aspartokinase
VKDLHTLPGTVIDSDNNLLIPKIGTRLKKIVRSQKRRARWVFEKLYTQRQRLQGTLEEILGAIGSEGVNVEVQWNNIQECVLDTVSGLVGKSRREKENHG